MFEREYLLALMLVLLVLVLTGCGREDMRVSARQSTQVIASSGVAQKGANSAAAAPLPANTVAFTLRSTLVDGRMAFMGADGTIAGQVNPTLRVPAGSSVRLTVHNGDGMMHDIAIPGLGVKSGPVNRKGAVTEVTFTVGQEPATWDYYCTVAGHRQAGMGGLLVVS